MKLLKKIILNILVIILVNLFIALTLCADLQSVIVNGIVKEVVKQQIVNKDFQEANTIIENITDNEQVNEILNSKEIQDLINKYIDIAIQGMIDIENIDDISIEQDMINYIKENKEIIEEKTGIEITDEMIEETAKEIQEQKISESFKETIQKTSENIPENQKVILKGYSFITSAKFRGIIIFLIILDILLIAIVQKSYYFWIKNVGDSLLASGIGITVMSIVVDNITRKFADFKILNTDILLKHGIYQGVIGIIIIICFKIILKHISKKEEKTYEISEEPTKEF